MRRKTIQSKIWHIIITMVVTLSVLMILVSSAITNQVKENLIYERLTSAKLLKSNQINNDNQIRDEESILVAHYKLLLSDNSIEISMDSFTEMIYGDDFEELNEVSEKILESNQSQGRFRFHGDYLYYSTQNIDGELLVFFTINHSGDRSVVLIILVGLVMIIFGYFISKKISKEIAKPILELEDYAEEISKRNWDIDQPLSNIEEIHQLSNSLEMMKSRLKKSEEKDRQFLQSTSHDLKTPVMIIKGYAQAILDHKDMNSAQVIIDESEKIERRIKQLLQYNTLDHTIINNKFQFFQLDRLIKRLVQKFETISPLSFQVSLKPYQLFGDSESILIAIENILDNQVRYATSVIHIRLDDELIIENDGDHFFTSDPNSLFDAYKKDQTGNFGLGLSIVHKVIQAHNGEITAKNIDNGVQFKIHFRDCTINL